MQLGVAVAIFILLAAFLMALFCIITRYFNKKLRDALYSQNEIYSLVNGGEGDTEYMAEGEYQDFVKKRIEDHKKKQKRKSNKVQLQLEMSNINQIYGEDESLYGHSLLKQRLQTPKTIYNNMPETTRSLISHKSFRPKPLSFRKTHKSKSRDSLSSNESIPNNEKKSPPLVKYSYIHKMIAYTQTGLEIVTNHVKQIWMQVDGEVKESKQSEKRVIVANELFFEETLESYGLEKDCFEAYKFIRVVEIPNMHSGQIYKVGSLKYAELKEQMNFPSFYLNTEDKILVDEPKQTN